jgi:hypothetical protein
VSVDGDRETPPASPVPDNGTTRGLPIPEFVIVRVPVLGPGLVGLKVTEIVHKPLGEKSTEHVPELENSLLATILLIVTFVVPMF